MDTFMFKKQVHRLGESMASSDCSSSPHNPNVTDDSCETPLHLESSQEAVEIIKILINYGAQADARDIHGCTPLDMARGKSDIEELLLAPRQLQYSCTFPGSGPPYLYHQLTS
jgi:ankyrin repeat protein